jgi:PAS domain S-box-containing protein
MQATEPDSCRRKTRYAVVAELDRDISSERVENARRRFEHLLQRFTTAPTERNLLPESLQELSTTVEELCVAAEELRHQNDELVATRTLLEEERQHFQDLFEFAPDGYIVTDVYGVIREANNNAASLLGVRRDFLVGKPMIVCIAQAEHVAFRRLLTRVQRGESVLNRETKLQPRDKPSFPVAVTVSRIHDKHPRAQASIGLRWILRDITLRKTAEAQLKTQLRRISVLRDINLAITATLDLQASLEVLLDRLTLLFPYPIAATVRLLVPETGKLKNVICRGLNDLEWQAHEPASPGRRTEEVLRSGLPVIAHNVQTDPQTRLPDFYIKNNLVSYLGVPLVIQAEVLGILCLYTKQEHEFTKDEIDSFSSLAVQAAIAIHNSQLYNRLKTQTRELRHARDELELRVRERTAELAKANDVLKSEITERRQVEEKLRESESRLISFANQLEDHLIANDRLISVGELSASIAHEFNNPLQIILGFVQNLIQEEDISEARQQDLRIVEDEARRCRSIIRNLLDFARPTGNEPIPIVVDTIVRDSIKLVRGYLDKFGIAVDIRIPQELPSIHGDPQPLKQVLINLFFNAVDAMPAGGTLTINAASDDASHLTLAVSDTGQGIHPEILPHIFQPFFTTKKRRGTGLGLSVCERIIKAHGGAIRVESSLENGTTFFLQFPLMEDKHGHGLS